MKSLPLMSTAVFVEKLKNGEIPENSSFRPSENELDLETLKTLAEALQSNNCP